MRPDPCALALVVFSVVLVACGCEIRERLLTMKDEVHVLLLVDGLELHSVFCVLSPACRTPTIEVFLDVMPTETTDLRVDPVLSIV